MYSVRYHASNIYHITYSSVYVLSFRGKQHYYQCTLYRSFVFWFLFGLFQYCANGSGSGSFRDLPRNESFRKGYGVSFVVVVVIVVFIIFFLGRLPQCRA